DPLFDYEHNQDWMLIANLLLTKDGMWRKRIDKKIGFPATEKNHKETLKKIIDDLTSDNFLRDLLHMVRYLPPPHYEEKQWSVLLSLFNLLPTATAELKRLFVEKNTSDYTELSDCAHQALGDNDNPTDLALMMDYRLKHIMVDEIQDTSARQYELIERLIQGWEVNDGRSLFLVGDPMQSIYKFRNASVSQFLLKTKHGIGELKPENLILRKNFRSGALLVNEFNNVFETILPKCEDLITGGVKFCESIPIAEKMNHGNYQLHTLFNESPKNEAIYTVNLIKKKVADTTGNIAVLVRSRLHLMPIMHALNREAINYKAIEIDRLTDLPEIIDLLSLTRALSHKNDKAAWLALLRSPLVGLTWKEILVLVNNDRGKSIWELLHEKQRIKFLSEDSQVLLSNFHEIITQFIDIGNMIFLRDRVERAWYKLRGPALLKSPEQLENIKRYLDVLGEIEVGGSLEDPSELEELIDNFRVSSSPVMEARIQVMTIHKAKGLEFDHVILPSLGRIARPSERTVLNWLENPINENEILISPIGSTENDKLHSYIQNSIKESETLELDRLLYVAFTRASRSLDVIGNVNVKNEDNNFSLKSPAKSSLLSRLWKVIEADFQREAKHQVNEYDKNIEVRKKYLIPTLKRINKDYQIPIDNNPIAFDSLSLAQNADKYDLIEFSWVGENAKQAGIIVHRWVHKFSLEKQIPAINDLQLYKDISKNWARNNYVKEEQLTDVINRVEETLINIIEDKDNHWFIIGNGFSELPLTGIWNKKCYSIIIDRINIDAKKNHWLIDYKTGTHRGGDVNKFINDEVVRYQGQLEKYATIYKNYCGVMPTVALYFPNLKKLQLV
ncbi:MAG: 3'-5' exonuclease, partial [Pseudomonadota bacterium]|nr:3'-5' exonuclease [Pseudomonadota bacterium]